MYIIIVIKIPFKEVFKCMCVIYSMLLFLATQIVCRRDNVTINVVLIP